MINAYRYRRALAAVLASASVTLIAAGCAQTLDTPEDETSAAALALTTTSVIVPDPCPSGSDAPCTGKDVDDSCSVDEQTLVCVLGPGYKCTCEEPQPPPPPIGSCPCICQNGSWACTPVGCHRLDNCAAPALACDAGNAGQLAYGDCG